MRKLIRNGMIVGLTIGMLSATAWAGRGGSTIAIESAIASGSEQTVLAELERAEKLACMSCVKPVLGLVDSPSYRVREAAGWWLTKRGVRDQVISQMEARLTASDPVAARNAADVLGGMRDYNTLSALSAYLAKPLDEASGIAAARAIGQIGHPLGLAALQVAFASPLAGVRAASLAAVRELRAKPGEKAVTSAQPLLPLFGDADVNVRRQAVMTAGFVEDRAAVGALSTLLTGDSSPLVRKAAAWALGQIGDAGAATALQAATSDTDPLVRSVASAALGRLK
ncbi:MAG TPA: HEAT repeat domain-containing protein [Polyangia bacterium]